MGLPTTDGAIRAAAEQRGTLPEPIRRRLLRDDGGAVRLDLDGEEEWGEPHPAWDDSSCETMRRSANHLVREQEGARASPHCPEGAIPLDDYDGAQLVLLADEDGAHVRFHETGDVQPVDVGWDG